MESRLARIDDGLRRRIEAVRAIVFDVDGVLTDGQVILGDDGFELKAFSTRDGLGIRLLQNSGVEVGIITGRTSTVVSRRAEELGVRHLMQNRSDKGPALAEMLQQIGIEPAHAAYVGDDMVDLPAMRAVVLGVSVAGADAFTREHAHYVTAAPGGGGAAREICELIMAVQGTLADARARYLD